MPAPVTDVLTSVDDLASSVPLEDLRTVVDEFGKAFDGHGDDLQVLLDSGSDFVEAADRALPSTTLLINDGETVLRTQAQEARAIRDFAVGAKDLAAALKGSDADLRRLLAVTPEAATQVSGLLRDLDPSLGVVLANLLTTSEVAVTRQRGIEELLVKYPAAVSAGATAVDGGKLDLGLAVTFFSPCPAPTATAAPATATASTSAPRPPSTPTPPAPPRRRAGRTYAARPTPRRAARSPTRPPPAPCPRAAAGPPRPGAAPRPGTAPRPSPVPSPCPDRAVRHRPA